MIKDHNDYFELEVIIDKYRKKLVALRDPNKKLIKDDTGKALKEEIQIYTGYFKLPTRFLKDGITLYGSVTNDRDRILKTRSTIYDKYTNKFYVVGHPLDEIEKKLNERQVVGFQLSRHKTKK